MDFEKIFISEKMIGKRLARSTLVPTRAKRKFGKEGTELNRESTASPDSSEQSGPFCI